MGVYLIEGFENWGEIGTNSTTLISRVGWVIDFWENQTGSATSLVAGRGGGIAMNRSSISQDVQIFLPQVDEIIIGFAFKCWEACTPIDIRDGSYDNLELYISNTGRGYLRDHDNVTYGSSFPIRLGVWNYLEIRMKVHSTAGEVEARLNGETVVNATGLGTDCGNNDRVDRLAFYTWGSSGCSFDDLYIVDPSTPGQDTFLGPISIRALRPNGDTADADFTPSSGTEHYALVDETYLEATEYLDGSNQDDTELWEYEDLPAGTEIMAIALWTNAVATGTCATFAPLCKSDGTVYEQDTYSVLSSTKFERCQSLMEDDPATSDAWTTTTLNAAQFGVRRK